MKKFLDYLINHPFKKLEKKIEETTNEKLFIPVVHEGKFTIVPEVIRRCHFLTSTEKDVYYELLSWASTTKGKQDGFCKVTESHIRVNTNLGLSTVKKAIDSLYKKGFISKALDFDKANVYKIRGVERNPYVILSEWVFNIREKSINRFSELIVDNPQYNSSLSKKAYIEATMKIIKDETLFMKYIEKINSFLEKLYSGESNCDYTDVVDGIIEELHNEINQYYSEFTIIMAEKYKRYS